MVSRLKNFPTASTLDVTLLFYVKMITLNINLHLQISVVLFENQLATFFLVLKTTTLNQYLNQHSKSHL